MVFGVAWRVLGHAEDAEDVVQEVFLEAYRVHCSRGVRRWAGLLRRLATCRALDRLRQRRPTQSLDGLSLVGSTSGPDAAAIGRELATRLREAIGELSRREAEVFCLRHLDGLSYSEIAEALEINSGAVGVSLHKARARLQNLLTETKRGEKS
jgi:RNA polymerase sigma-70 factor (ECF subfamily)